MSDPVVIRYDEQHDSFDVVVGSETLFVANHDDDGWGGMSRIRDLLNILGGTLGFEVVEEGDPNV